MKKYISSTIIALLATVGISTAATNDSALQEKENAAWQAFKDKNADGFLTQAEVGDKRWSRIQVACDRSERSRAGPRRRTSRRSLAPAVSFRPSAELSRHRPIESHRPSVRASIALRFSSAA